ncbi:MAG: WG repeat-containing protein [Geobacteraceae bacterium]|nr:WG repeat-containing protein [Geobacteraceae bacterium]
MIRLFAMVTAFLCCVGILNAGPVLATAKKKTAGQDLMLIQMKVGSKYGYLNEQLQFVIPPQFDSAADKFFDGLSSVVQNGQTGYINKSGEYIINPQFAYGGDFSDGLAVVEQDGLRGYINIHGEFVLPPKFESANRFSGEVACVKQSGNWGCINKQGKLIVPFKFNSINDFSDGMARIEYGEKFGYINNLGQVVIEPQFETVYNFYEGLARVEIDGKCGFINKQGKIVIKPDFEDAAFFVDGVARAKLNGKWGYISKKGNFDIKPAFEKARNFSKGLAAVRQNSKWGFINKQGQFMIKPLYDTAFDFIGGIGRVEQNGKWGYINKQGRYVLEHDNKCGSDVLVASGKTIWPTNMQNVCGAQQSDQSDYLAFKNRQWSPNFKVKITYSTAPGIAQRMLEKVKSAVSVRDPNGIWNPYWVPQIHAAAAYDNEGVIVGEWYTGYYDGWNDWGKALAGVLDNMPEIGNWSAKPLGDTQRPVSATPTGSYGSNQTAPKNANEPAQSSSVKNEVAQKSAGYQTVKTIPMDNKLGYPQHIAEIKCNNGRKGFIYYDPRESYYKYSAGGALNWGDLRLANGNNQDNVAMEACRN